MLFRSDTILTVSERGFGKRTQFEDYRFTNRGGKGVINLKITEKTGKVIAVKNVDDTRDLMIINKSGIIIRIKVKDLRVMARNTQGVTLIRLKKNDSIASVTDLEEMGEDEIPVMSIVDDGTENVSGDSTYVADEIIDDEDELLDEDEELLDEEEEELDEEDDESDDKDESPDEPASPKDNSPEPPQK